MPFCPKCRYEYEVGTGLCPDCNVKLVASLADPADFPRGEDGVVYDNWVALARLSSSEYADMIEEVLRDNHIPVVTICGTGHFGLTGQMGLSSFRPIGGGYTIAVPEDFVADADACGLSVLGEDWEKGRLVDIDERD